MDDGIRQMLTRAELRELAAGGVAISVHGKTHTPIPRAEDLDAELATAHLIVGDHPGTDDDVVPARPLRRNRARAHQGCRL